MRRRRAGTAGVPWRRRLAFALLLVAAACARQPQGQVWFTPNIGSRDMLALFTQPERWRTARDRVDVFKLYAIQVLADRAEDCPTCGDNRQPNLVQVNAFRKLRAWRIAAALEVGAVTSYACTGAETAPPVLDAIGRVEAAGGTVTYLALNEPRLTTPKCGQTADDTAAQVSDFARLVHGSYPRVAIGDIEPYPILSVTDIQTWIESLDAHGVALAFLHLDVDNRHVARAQVDVAGDLAQLRAFCQQRQLPFGVIVFGQDGTSDRAYYDDALPWVDRISAAIGRPEQLIFQSWVLSPDGSSTVPVNLPENDPTIFSHTRLILDGLARFPSQ